MEIPSNDLLFAWESLLCF